MARVNIKAFTRDVSLGLRFLIRLEAKKVPREVLLPAVRTVAKTLGVDPRNPKWTSYGALELDVFSATRADFDLFISAVTPLAVPEFTKDLNIAPPHREDAELFAEARELFNEERYWECHEVLEGIWKRKHGEEKRLLQGIILVCAALVHHQKGEESVALGVLGRAIKQLEFSKAFYGGFKVAGLRGRSEEMIRKGRLEGFRV